MPKVLVIGSNSFTGSHFVDAILARGDSEVIGVSRSPQPNPVMLPYSDRDLKSFRFHQVDLVRSFDAFGELLDRECPDVVINVAALSIVEVSNDLPIEYYETNTVATVRLIDLLRKRDWLKRYIHISSAEIYGTCDHAVEETHPFNPSTPYAVSKAAADMHLSTVCDLFGFPATVVRSTNVFGPHQQLFKIIPRTAIFAKLGRTIELHGGGVAAKSFVHIRDVVRGALTAMDQERSGVFHFSVPSERTIAEAVLAVCEQLKIDFESATTVVDERPGQDTRYWLDCTKAERLLAWRSEISFAQGIEETISWIDDNWQTIKSLPHTYKHKT